jgi:hypothetical protein
MKCFLSWVDGKIARMSESPEEYGCNIVIFGGFSKFTWPISPGFSGSMSPGLPGDPAAPC